MLKFPFEFIGKENNTNYYLFNQEGSIPHLVFEDEATLLMQITKRKKVKSKQSKITTGLKMLPLTSNVLFIFMQSALLKHLGTKQLKGMEEFGATDYYETWDESDAKELADVYRQMIENKGDKDMWDFTTPTKNPVVEGFIEDGYFLLTTKLNGSIERIYLLYRPTLIGNLVIALVRDVGVAADTLTANINTFVLSKDLVKAVLKKFDV